MRKKFNDTGLCISKKHYMADTSAKISAIMRMVEDGAYFTINRPRQYGKTTNMQTLFLTLNSLPEYLAIKLSFEGLGDAMFENEETFCKSFLDYLGYRLQTILPDYANFLIDQVSEVSTFKHLNKATTKGKFSCRHAYK